MENPQGKTVVDGKATRGVGIEGTVPGLKREVPETRRGGGRFRN